MSFFRVGPFLVALFLWFQFIAWFDPPRRCDSLLPHAAALKALFGFALVYPWCIAAETGRIGNDVDPLSSSKKKTPPVVGRWLKNFTSEKLYSERCLPTKQGEESDFTKHNSCFFLSESRIEMPKKYPPKIDSCMCFFQVHLSYEKREEFFYLIWRMKSIQLEVIVLLESD